MQVGGPNRIDFIGTGDFAGYTFELTTEAGVAGHALRAYMQEPGSMIFTYIPIVQSELAVRNHHIEERSSSSTARTWESRLRCPDAGSFKKCEFERHQMSGFDPYRPSC
jgi:hypothetical protein